MSRCALPLARVPALAVASLLLAAGTAGAWPLGGPLYNGGYAGWADPFPPSYYGYNLDDPHPGYYGGIRYREYYSFGRGYGWATFPDSLPTVWPPRPWVTWPHTPAAPPAPPVVQPLPGADPLACRLEVHVPEGAEVWIDDMQSKQTGPVREFVSPSLAPGMLYAYHVRARWTRDGRPTEQAQAVEVSSGSRARVDFPTAPETAGVAQGKP
jgi:uncharacterized protein (TIGR03000 family)